MVCYSWEDLPLNSVNPFKSYRTFKGEKIKIHLLTLEPGYVGGKHRHQSEQISVILKGRMKVKMGKEEQIVQEGDLVHIPENLPHQTETLGEETIIIEVFSPAEYQKEVLD